MRRKLRILAEVFSLLLVLTCSVGCTFRFGKPGPYMGDETALFTVATFNIPEICQIATGIDVVEKDDQGRVLFRVTGGNSALYYRCYGEHGKLYALAICQRYDEKTVYYYEDDCYLLYADAEDFSTKDEEQLKERNDWNQPLNYEKMTGKTIIPKEDMGYKYQTMSVKHAISIMDGEAKKLFLKQIDVDEKDIVFTSILDDDGQGRVLLTVEVARAGRWKVDLSTLRCYLEMYDTKHFRGERAVIEEVQDPSHIWVQIKEFKKQNNWHMP